MRHLVLPRPPATNAVAACEQLLASEPTVVMLNRIEVRLQDHGITGPDLDVSAFHLMWDLRNHDWASTFSPDQSAFTALALGARLLYLGALGALSQYSDAARTHHGDQPGLVALHAASHLPSESALTYLLSAAYTGNELHRDIAAYAFDRHPHRPSVMLAQLELTEKWSQTSPNASTPWYHRAQALSVLNKHHEALHAIDRALDLAAADEAMTLSGRGWAEESYNDRREHVLARLITDQP